MIRITTDGEGAAFKSVTITDQSGTLLQDVTGVTIRITPDSVVTAQIEVATGPLDIIARPLLTREVLDTCAASHGLRLVPIGEGEG